jgi:hypothetical protein
LDKPGTVKQGSYIKANIFFDSGGI